MTVEPAIRLGFALLLASACFLAAHAEPSKPTPDTNPFRANEPQPEPKAKSEAPPAKAPSAGWSDTAVSDAKARCTELLKDLRLDFEPLPPIRHGACGTAAPILVKSIGENPKVVIQPPATINCRLAVALNKWLTETVQPTAEAEFGSRVVKLKNAASYACRNRYGGADMPLSEHARANALDISDFVLESGEHVTVLTAWPRIVGPVLPPRPTPNPNRLAAAEDDVLPANPRVSEMKPVDLNTTEVTKAIANPFIPPAEAMPNPEPKSTSRAKSNPFTASTKISAQPPTTKASLQSPTAKVVAPDPPAKADRLVPEEVEEPPPLFGPLTERKTAFVRKVHKDACKKFGTVLGPNANAAHRNHFHLDMMERRAGFCQ
jgi:hypothetical protein